MAQAIFLFPQSRADRGDVARGGPERSHLSGLAKPGRCWPFKAKARVVYGRSCGLVYGATKTNILSDPKRRGFSGHLGCCVLVDRKMLMKSLIILISSC